MKKVIVIILLGGFLFSCKTRKKVVSKPTKPKTEAVVVNKEQPQKVYANDTERYIDIYKTIAQNEMKLYNIPASITLAQGILESGSGNGRLSVKANNHFGIKCHEWTGAKIYHDDDKRQECFRKYKDPKYSFRDHSLFLKDRKRYAGLFELKQSNYKAWAKGLKAAGYATDKKYPQKLISLIERYRLYEYDKEVLGSTYWTIDTPKKSQLTYVVVKGDTLYSISKKYNITVEELQRINGLSDTSLSIGQELMVEVSKDN
ncbi:glucosaminidase domain-containing protein [Seonamhaeicola sp. ML3]|uniref:glucosaminidase domain-containing protein n=1 Tax=Seonamhaeicola sp. ML3 TaxID=2937786 RepID=UPI00200BF8BF|nr:glucosaminidase domain-containing protein [Seonamhaeicola sp. ML3]